MLKATESTIDVFASIKEMFEIWQTLTIYIQVFEIYLTFKTVEILHTPTYLKGNTLLKSL